MKFVKNSSEGSKTSQRKTTLNSIHVCQFGFNIGKIHLGNQLVMSQCNSNSYWIMQENGTDQPKVYRKTRTMLKIRSTDVKQTRHNYSQSTELEKAKFQTPATSNVARNCVEHNSVENVSQDLVHPTKSELKLLLLLILNQKKGRKSQKLQMYLNLHLHIHLHLHWRESKNSPTLQDPESQ